MLRKQTYIHSRKTKMLHTSKKQASKACSSCDPLSSTSAIPAVGIVPYPAQPRRNPSLALPGGSVYRMKRLPNYYFFYRPTCFGGALWRGVISYVLQQRREQGNGLASCDKKGRAERRGEDSILCVSRWCSIRREKGV